MKPTAWKIIVIIALVGCIPLAWWLGRRDGIKEGTKAGVWHGNMNTIAMILSSRAIEEQGDFPRARDFINDALYLNASSLDMNQGSTALTDDNRAAGESILTQVADYYWRHPDTYELDVIEDATSPSDPVESAITEAMEPLLEIANEHQRRTRAILMRHKPSNAEQDAALKAQE